MPQEVLADAAGTVPHNLGGSGRRTATPAVDGPPKIHVTTLHRAGKAVRREGPEPARSARRAAG
jgi:hypothetical protein